jgi:hypothetical protein
MCVNSQFTDTIRNKGNEKKGADLTANLKSMYHWQNVFQMKQKLLQNDIPRKFGEQTTTPIKLYSQY